MLKYFIFSILNLSSFLLYAQTIVIAKQGFENDGNAWSTNFSTPPCTNNSETWNYRTSLGNITPSEGEQFWGIQDLNGNCGSNGFESIMLGNVDVSSYTNVMLSFAYNVFEFDNGDDIKYELFYNNQSQGEVMLFEGNNNLSTNGWVTITISIPNYVSQLKLNILVKQNGKADYAGIDNVVLSGLLISPCSELLISEYVEGTSNNKYIEIYNPTGQDIDLSGYNLTKFIGKNENSTGSLSLTGTIDSYGTYLIKNQNESLNINADLSTGSIMDFNGDDKVALRKNEEIIDIIGVIGDSIYFAKDKTLRRKSNIQNPNNQYNEDEWDVYGLDDISNLNSHVSNCKEPIPEIEVSGNSNPISDGSILSNIYNHTYLGAISLDSGNSITKEFFIKNTGDANLEINDIKIEGNDKTQFSIIGNTALTIIPTDSIAIEVSFSPNSKGLKSAVVTIDNNDASENPFNFLINAEATGNTNSPLMITQYYEGDGNNKWIEITNISDEIVSESYYLALFRNEKAENPIDQTPNNKTLIPQLLPKQTITYCSTLISNNIIYAQDGSEIKNPICNFNGNDIIVISTNNDKNCWKNKVDLIGNSTFWGENISFVRKYGCESVLPSTGFAMQDWFVFDVSEINSATTGYNARIGEHFIGTAIFENNSWTNGLPDENRTVEIKGDYDVELNGEFEACNLIVNNGGILKINANTSITILNNLTVNGILEVLHEGSLVMINNNGLVNANGTISIHKTTTTLKPYDYTYWSSPVKNALLEEVFAASPQNSFYQFVTSEFNDNNKDQYDDDGLAAWQKANGVMLPGIGYTAMAPNGEPFVTNQSVVFNGEINNGIVPVQIFLSSKDSIPTNDWNFIGNPYPSAIDANIFLNDSVNKNLLGGAIYFWTHNTAKEGDKYTSDDYASYVLGTGGIKANSNGKIPTATIASCQGFFVEAQQEGEIHFNNRMRVKIQNNSFFKTDQPKDDISKQEDKIWLNLYNNEGAFSQILIGFINGADNSIERNYDALRLSGNNFISFYSFAENKKLAIQGLGAFTGKEKLNLGFTSKIEEPVKLKIGIDKINGNLGKKEIFIYDKLLNKIHNLNDSPYELEVLTKGVFDNRFSLIFDKSIFDKEQIYRDSNELLIKNTNTSFLITTTKQKIIHSIKVYDVLGRAIINKNSDTSTVTLSKQVFPKKGVYILVGKVKDDKFLTKKLIFI